MKTLQDFLEEYDLQDNYDEWLGDKVEDLTKQEFYNSLRGQPGSIPLLPAFENFWISVYGKYVKDEDPNLIPDLTFAKIVLPSDIFLEPTTKAHISGTESVDLTCNNGFIYCDYKDYDDISKGSTVNAVLTLKGEPYIRNFAELQSDQRLYVKQGSVLKFSFSKKPDDDSDIAITFAANKLREVPSDTGVVKGVAAMFYLEDSVIGPYIHGIGEEKDGPTRFYFEDYSNKLWSDSSWIHEEFTKAYNIQYQKTGYKFRNSEGTLTIKNLSNIPRVLTIRPFNSTTKPDDNGKFSNVGLSNNVSIENGAIVIEFAPNQGN